MNEENKRRWDVRLGIAAPLLTLLGVFLGLFQFNVGERNKARLEHDLAAESSRLEFRRTIWLEQLKTYKLVADLAGRIAAAPKLSMRPEAAADQFLAAYWGSMIFHEDRAVERAMVDFAAEIRMYREGFSNERRLRDRADRLVTVMRASSERGWHEITNAEKPEAKKA